MTNPQNIYLNALRRILRPLLRALINKGITLPALTQLLKQTYVEAAQDFTLPGKPLTDSRISLITGLHRRDVKTIREELEQEVPSQPPLSIGSRVISQWTGNSDYLNAKGLPKVLPKHGDGSFEYLVSSINKDFRARTLLDEWISKDIVSVDGEDMLQLHVEAFVPSDDEQEMLGFFGDNLGHHMAAATHNLLTPEQRLLERAAYHNGLSQESIDVLQDMAQKGAMELLVAINHKAVALAQDDAQLECEKLQYRFGAYFYHSGIESESAKLEAKQGSK